MGARTGKTATAEPPAEEKPNVLGMAPATQLAYAKQAWMHLNAGRAIPPDEELLEQLPALMEAIDAPPPEETSAPSPVEEGLAAVMSDKDTPAWVKGIVAAQAMTTNKLTEAMLGLVEQQAAHTGREIELKGSVDDLVAQMSGTVSTGPPPKNPLEAPVTFIARGTEFKAVRKSRHRTMMPNGDQVFTTGITYDFAPTGRFTTIDPDAVRWLEARPGMNVEYWRADAPPNTAPDPGLVIERVIDLTLGLDDAGLEKLLQQEQASWKRKVVIDAINRARSKVQGWEG